MFRKHVFNVLVAIALAITLAFTVREALATTAIPSATEMRMKCASLPSRNSIHTEVVNGFSVTYSEDGPVGVDGGLPELLTAYRTCTK